MRTIMASPSDLTGQSLTSLEYWFHWKTYQIERITFPDGYVLTIGGEMKLYRFFYQGEVFFMQWSQIKTNVLYFEDWCWMVIEQHRFFSRNTHEMIPYPSKGNIIDVHLEKGYGDYDQS